MYSCIDHLSRGENHEAVHGQHSIAYKSYKSYINRINHVQYINHLSRGYDHKAVRSFAAVCDYGPGREVPGSAPEQELGAQCQHMYPENVSVSIYLPTYLSTDLSIPRQRWARDRAMDGWMDGGRDRRGGSKWTNGERKFCQQPRIFSVCRAKEERREVSHLRRKQGPDFAHRVEASKERDLECVIVVLLLNLRHAVAVLGLPSFYHNLYFTFSWSGASRL